MRALVAGTAGHVDHGKTALVRALTGVETDRWEEERERGLTIDLGFAPLDLGEGLDAAIVDVPGHEDFVTNMLAGVTGLDLLILVVAADEGPMPQTREHLTIASLLGVDEGIVALTKVDRVEEAWLELAADAVREELRTVLGHAEWPILPISAVEGSGLEPLREALRERAEGVRPRPEEDLFRLPVDRSFTVKGAGTVVTGTVWSGSVGVGEELRILPGGEGARVRGLQEHGTERRRVAAGRRCALALAGPDPEDVPRGHTLVTGPAWEAVDRIGVLLELPPYARWGVEQGQRVRVYLGTREVMARVDLPEEALRPGESGPVRLRLEAPLVARVGDPLIVRFYSPVVTIGGGRVADLEPGSDWPERAATWGDVVEGGSDERLAAAVRLAGGRGLPVVRAAVAVGLRAPEVERLAARPPQGVVRVGDRWFATEVSARLADGLLEALGAFHRRNPRSAAAPLEELRHRVESEGYAPVLVERAVERLSEGGDLVVEGPDVRLPGHEPRLTEEEAAALERLVEMVREGGWEPPTVDALGERLEIEERLLHDLLELAVADDRLEPIDAEIYLSPQVARQLRDRGRRVLERREPAEASHFKEAFGVSRKYLIPYLQHLDARGISRRTEEGRVRGGAQST